jgi:hypothetical protein
MDLHMSFERTNCEHHPAFLLLFLLSSFFFIFSDFLYIIPSIRMVGLVVSDDQATHAVTEMSFGISPNRSSNETSSTIPNFLSNSTQGLKTTAHKSKW